MTHEHEREQQCANAQGLAMKADTTVALDSLERARTRLQRTIINVQIEHHITIPV
jgi:hypothetical protein